MLSRSPLHFIRTSLLLAGLALTQAALALAQPAAAAVTAADYARAEKLLAATVNPLVVGGGVNAT